MKNGHWGNVDVIKLTSSKTIFLKFNLGYFAVKGHKSMVRENKFLNRKSNDAILKRSKERSKYKNKKI